jgi:hypothetical protein
MIKGGKNTPLTEKVNFKSMLQRGNRIQVPELIRCQFKIETNQTLNVGVNDLNTQSGWQFFYAKMQKDGRILIPLLIIKLLKEDESDITGHILEATIEPGQTTQ